MEHIRIEVVGNTARAAERPGRITSGTVGLPVYFSFDSQWDGLKKTAVFRAGRVCRTVDSLGTETAVPWEVLERPNVWLSIGVYGVNEDGSVAIPTIWTNVRVIQAGASPEGDPGTEPTLPVWQKLLNTVGNLFGLKTKAKTSIVDAVNEVRALAMGGGVVPDVTLSESGVPADAKATGDAIGGILGKDNTVLSESSVAFGEGNTVGLLGYYWSNIDFSTKTITLSTVQGEEVWSNDTVVTWTAGDVVSIVNNTKYECCAKIVSIDGNAITLDSLPFYRVDDPDDFSFDDRGIFVPDKPTEGIVDLGKQSAAIGLGNKASNWCAVAVGRENVAQGQYSFVAGRGNVGKAYAGYIEGLYNTQENTALYSHVEGLQNTVRGKVSHAEGAGNETNGDYAHAEGYHTKAGESAAHAEGNATQATGPAAHAEGNGTKATVKHAHAEGDRTEATEWAAHAEGIGSKATGWAAHAEGNATQAGAKAHAEGVSSIASAEAAHAEGSSTKASALGAHSEGRETVASDEGAHAEGFKSKASMLYTHAEGRQTEASGENAHAEGRETVASAREAHAEGFQTKARAAYAHAEGCMTTADGGGSHAQGGATKALGEYSSAEGGWTIAREQCQSVAGKYNADDPNALYIVGVGTSDSARKNGFGVRKDGTSTLYGNRLTEVGDPSTSTDAANKGYVDDPKRKFKQAWGKDLNLEAYQQEGYYLAVHAKNGPVNYTGTDVSNCHGYLEIARYNGSGFVIKAGDEFYDDYTDGSDLIVQTFTMWNGSAKYRRYSGSSDSSKPGGRKWSVWKNYDTNTDTNTTYSLSQSGRNITLTGSDNSKKTVTVPETGLQVMLDESVQSQSYKQMLSVKPDFFILDIQTGSTAGGPTEYNMQSIIVQSFTAAEDGIKYRYPFITYNNNSYGNAVLTVSCNVTGGYSTFDTSVGIISRIRAFKNIT